MNNNKINNTKKIVCNKNILHKNIHKALKQNINKIHNIKNTFKKGIKKIVKNKYLNNNKNTNKHINKIINYKNISTKNKAKYSNPINQNITNKNSVRLNKAMSMLGICSRRDADKYISNKSVYINGVLVNNLGKKVNNGDIITVNEIEYKFTNNIKTRIWIYNKPSGLVTTHKDEKNRNTVFDNISDKIGQRVISIGRLDLNSEGLLLLTNDGSFARYAESPNTGWERHYKIRFFGEVNENILKQINTNNQNILKNYSNKNKNIIQKGKQMSTYNNNKANIIEAKNKTNTYNNNKANTIESKKQTNAYNYNQANINIQIKDKNIENSKTNINNDNSQNNLEKMIIQISNGITIDGIKYSPIKTINISNNKGLNKWCTCILKEGKNREIRKIFNYFGLQVNKLVRIKYGPYELGDLKTGEIREVRNINIK